MNAGFHSFSDGIVMQEKVGNPYVPYFCRIDNILGAEIGDAIHAAKPDGALLIFEWGIFIELIPL